MQRRRKLLVALLVILTPITFILTAVDSKASVRPATPKAAQKTAIQKNDTASAKAATTQTTRLPEITDALKEIGLTAPSKQVKAPDFDLLDLEGKPIRLSQYRGSIVLLGFWATW